MKRRPEGGGLTVAGARVRRGERKNVKLKISEKLSGDPVAVPIHVWRARTPGPTVFITGALHGDEINGTGIIRELIRGPGFELACGSLILVPVLNVLGFERHSRYLPDRRDLNRSFPGSSGGSMASRIAHKIFKEIVAKSDYGIDLHTAAVQRTNFPNVRGALDDPEVARLARAFGCEVIVDGGGPEGSLRAEACLAGRPTILLEAGEVWKVEPGVVAYGVRGIRNALIELGLVKGRRERPAYQAVVHDTRWVRAKAGGFLQFHVAPGDVVDRGQPIATNSSILGRELNVLLAPEAGIVIGMTTQPAVVPGNPVCHVAIPDQGVESIRRALRAQPKGSLHARMRRQLATALHVSKPK